MSVLELYNGSTSLNWVCYRCHPSFRLSDLSSPHITSDKTGFYCIASSVSLSKAVSLRRISRATLGVYYRRNKIRFSDVIGGHGDKLVTFARKSRFPRYRSPSGTGDRIRNSNWGGRRDIDVWESLQSNHLLLLARRPPGTSDSWLSSKTSGCATCRRSDLDQQVESEIKRYTSY